MTQHPELAPLAVLLPNVRSDPRVIGGAHLAELFAISRPTVYRTLGRQATGIATGLKSA